MNVSKFLCECLGVTMGADTNDQNQSSDQPQAAGKRVIDRLSD